jgi:hypothetical protein
MEKDFHYYCIGTLARASGFAPEDALTIAYASQYVDDSTESEPMRIGEMIFDPVRTSYEGLRSYDWSVQKRVLIPFHFISYARKPQAFKPGDEWHPFGAKRRPFPA